VFSPCGGNIQATGRTIDFQPERINPVRVAPTAVLVLTALFTVACSSSADTGAANSTPAPVTASTTSSKAAPPADGPKREINKPMTVKDADGDSAVVTLVSMRESKGRPDDLSPPESGNYVIIELSFEGKTGEFFASGQRVRLKKPDGTLVETGDGNGIHAVDSKENIDSDDVTAGKVVKGSIGFDTVLAPGTKVIVVDSSDKALAEWPLQP
jgi:hypothetical protein